VSGVNYSTSNLTVTSVGGTSTLASFNRVGGGTSAGGRAGAAGGGTAAQSLIWDPASDPTAPLNTAATNVGLYDSFANATVNTTIGSPSVVPEPSTYALLALAGAGLAAFRPAPTLAAKRPRLTVPRIVPPIGMMPSTPFGSSFR
jgi:hypothetical protein